MGAAIAALLLMGVTGLEASDYQVKAGNIKPWP